MPKRIKLRHMSASEEESVRQLAASRTAERRHVQRARVIVHLLDEPGLTPSEASLRAGFATEQSGIAWVKRFNSLGVDGLWDAARSGAPPTYTDEVRRALLVLARATPKEHGYPFERWSLVRLQRALEERQGVRVARSTLWEWLKADELASASQQ